MTMKHPGARTGTVSAREDARHGDGRFGEQSRAETGVTLSPGTPDVADVADDEAGRSAVGPAAHVRPTAPRLSAQPGTCSQCKRRRDVFPAQRYGGGNYRRPHRYYRSSVCAECAVDHLRAAVGREGNAYGLLIRAMEEIAASLGTDEANDLVDRHRQLREHRTAAREAARAEYARAATATTVVAARPLRAGR